MLFFHPHHGSPRHTMLLRPTPRPCPRQPGGRPPPRATVTRTACRARAEGKGEQERERLEAKEVFSRSPTTVHPARLGRARVAAPHTPGPPTHQGGRLSIETGCPGQGHRVSGGACVGGPAPGPRARRGKKTRAHAKRGRPTRPLALLPSSSPCTHTRTRAPAITEAARCGGAHPRRQALYERALHLLSNLSALSPPPRQPLLPHHHPCPTLSPASPPRPPPWPPPWP